MGWDISGDVEASESINVVVGKQHHTSIIIQSSRSSKPRRGQFIRELSAAKVHRQQTNRLSNECLILHRIPHKHLPYNPESSSSCLPKAPTTNASPYAFYPAQIHPISTEITNPNPPPPVPLPRSPPRRALPPHHLPHAPRVRRYMGEARARDSEVRCGDEGWGL